MGAATRNTGQRGPGKPQPQVPGHPYATGPPALRDGVGSVMLKVLQEKHPLIRRIHTGHLAFLKEAGCPQPSEGLLARGGLALPLPALFRREPGREGCHLSGKEGSSPLPQRDPDPVTLISRASWNS